MNKLLLILGFLILCTSCSKVRFPVKENGYEIKDRLLDTADYKINAGDKLTVQSFNNLASVLFENSINGAASNMSSTLPQFDVFVDNLGYITLPKIGRLQVGGLTQMEASTKIERAYKDIINNPSFNIRVANMRVKVVGAVNHQGLYYLERENQRLGEVLALAGGINFEQLGKKLFITRHDGDSTYALEFDIDINQIANPRMQGIVMRDNDEVYVQPSRATVGAARAQRLNTYLQPILLLLNSAILIVTLTK